VDALPDIESVEDEVDEGAERAQAVAEGALGELEEREIACGRSNSAYPFELGYQTVSAKRGTDWSIYAFLLLLGRYGKDAGPPGSDGADLFERVCAAAAVEYFGGADHGAQSYLFGFPRRIGKAGFSDALDDLCLLLNEGGGHRHRPTSRAQKDAKLDIVAWKAFDDGRPGKLIGFGQCATGADWPAKLTELLPDSFCRKWMHEVPPVPPIRMFFIPFRLERSRWYAINSDGGVMFDRCRIVGLTRGIDRLLKKECAAWARFVINRKINA